MGGGPRNNEQMVAKLVLDNLRYLVLPFYALMNQLQPDCNGREHLVRFCGLREIIVIIEPRSWSPIVLHDPSGTQQSQYYWQFQSRTGLNLCDLAFVERYVGEQLEALQSKFPEWKRPKARAVRNKDMLRKELERKERT